MPYYRGSGKGYPHPDKDRSGWTLFYIRNRQGTGLRVAVPDAEAPKLAPFDLYQDHAGTIWARPAFGRQQLLARMVTAWELYRHVEKVS